MIIDKKFFKDVHSYFRTIAENIIIPKIGKLNENEISTKSDNSKVTSYDVVIENELIKYFLRIGIHCPLHIPTERSCIKTRGGYKIFLGGSIGLVYLKTPILID